MNIEELRKHIETIINNTFMAIDDVFWKNREGATMTATERRLVFPKYRGEKNRIRVSEQELRFLFIEQFNKYIESFNKSKDKEKLDLFYSIETPSEERYNFSSSPKQCLKECEKGGQSAQFDTVIYNKEGERICLIEFKNNSNNSGEHEKDFLKLSKESVSKKRENRLCYFISIAEASDGGTIGEKSNSSSGIIPKFRSFDENKDITFENITYICHCLENRSAKGFDTIYAGTVSEQVKNEFGWVEKNKIFEKK